MGWLKKIGPPHKCPLPLLDRNDVGVGSIWQCEQYGCDKVYIVVIYRDVLRWQILEGSALRQANVNVRVTPPQTVPAGASGKRGCKCDEC